MTHTVLLIRQDSLQKTVVVKLFLCMAQTPTLLSAAHI